METARVLIALVGLTLMTPAWLPAQAGDAETHLQAGLMHLRDGRADLALDQFKRAVKADDKNPYALKGLGIAYLETGSPDKAIEAFRKALEVNPYYADIHNDLGTALIKAGKTAEGKAEFVLALNDPTNPTPEKSAYNLGVAYLEEKNYAEAANWFLSSIKRNKSYPSAYIGLADALIATGRLEDALLQLEMGLKELPDYPCLLSATGKAKLKAGRFTEARAHLQAAADKDPVGACGRDAREQLGSLPH